MEGLTLCMWFEIGDTSIQFNLNSYNEIFRKITSDCGCDIYVAKCKSGNDKYSL